VHPLDRVDTFVFSPRAPDGFSRASHGSAPPEPEPAQAAGEVSTAALRAQYVELRAQLEAERAAQLQQAGARAGDGLGVHVAGVAVPEGPGSKEHLLEASASLV